MSENGEIEMSVNYSLEHFEGDKNSSTNGKIMIKNGNENGRGIRSYNKWSPTEQGATLVWRDLCVYAYQGNEVNLRNLKRIINNSTGAIQPGTLMALMGSRMLITTSLSKIVLLCYPQLLPEYNKTENVLHQMTGSGKSTLMSALAYRQPVGTVVQGDILINGRRAGPFMHRLSGYVHQEDLFLGSLTVLEHLTFMAHLRLDRRTSDNEKYAIIQDLLERAGLSSSSNTRIGNGDDKKVLSGGEKKRLAFATELLTNPVILFCDEPTTGLDSYSAQQLIMTLHSLAQKGTTIMCTIHQPSSQLFAMFHNVLLLADGRVAFMGAPEQALQFFAEHGYHCPETYNPADFLIGVLASAPGNERASLRAAYHLCDLFAVSSAAKQRDMLVNLEFHMAESADYPYDSERDDYKYPFWLTTLFWVFYRNLVTVFRDPTVQLLRFLQKMAIGIVMGLCFTGTVTLSQAGVQAVQGALFVMVSENTFHPMYSILSVFPQGLPLFLREKRSGIYTTAQYYIAITGSMLPGMILEPLLFVIVCYWLAGLKPTFYAFFITAISLILVMNIATACGCLFSTAFSSVALAMAFLVPMDYIFMITSGIFIRISTIPAAFSWTQYLSWMLYANEAMTIVQWNDVYNITCVQVIPDLPCLHDGEDVLEKYSFSSSHLYRNLWAMLTLYFVFHFLAYFFLWKRARKM